jgi:hypothetical protein
MSVVWTSPHLRLIFRINSYTGLSIPDKTSASNIRRRICYWDVLFIALAMVTLICTLYVIVETMPSYNMTNFAQPLLTFIVYANCLSKGAYFIWQKDEIVNILNSVDDIVGFNEYFKSQKRAFYKATFQTKRILVILMHICLPCFALQIIIVIFLTRKYESMDKNYENHTITQEESHSYKYLTLESVAILKQIIVSVNSFYILVLHLKNISMDCLMLFCHVFVVEQIKSLHATIQQQSFSGQKKINDDWIFWFNKIKYFTNNC